MRRILIVDDDQEIRELVREILEEEGYRATEAANGATALDLLRNSQEQFVALLD